MHTVVLIQCYTAIFIMIIWWYHLLLKTCLSQEAYSTWSIIYNMVCTSRVVLSEAVDWYICFTRKNQHGGYPKRSRPQGLNDCATSELSMRAWTWNVTDSEKTILDLIIEQYFQIWLSEEMARCGPVEGHWSTISINLNLQVVEPSCGVAVYFSNPQEQGVLYCEYIYAAKRTHINHSQNYPNVGLTHVLTLPKCVKTT